MGEAGQRSRLFGTDGVRGVAGQDLTARLALDLSAAAAAVLGGAVRGGAVRGGAVRGGAVRGAAVRRAAAPGEGAAGRPVAVVGRDSRASGEFLEAAVVAGLAGA